MLAALPNDFSGGGKEENDNPVSEEGIDAEELGELRRGFSRRVWEKIAHEKRYPRTARNRGYEGRPVVGFVLGTNGRLTDLFLIKSSPHKLLDRAALDAVKRGDPYPPIPPPLKLDSIRFNLPISFILEEP